MEIEIRGEGELVMRFIDKTGQTLMQERLTVSGSPKIGCAPQVAAGAARGVARRPFLTTARR